MCAIIGAIIKNPTKEDFSSIRRVFLESKIRGLHATGMSVLVDDVITSFVEAVPADKFNHLDNLEDMVNSDGVLYLIGHCRYSTSDLEFSQPIYNSSKSIAHNGVITQEDPSTWVETYGYEFSTKNDSELILHTENPLLSYPDASIAAVELRTNRTIRAYRNGKRPLYLSSFKNGCIITSTMDIAKRSQLTNVGQAEMNIYYTIDSNIHTHIEVVSTMNKDYQR